MFYIDYKNNRYYDVTEFEISKTHSVSALAFKDKDTHMKHFGYSKSAIDVVKDCDMNG